MLQEEEATTVLFLDGAGLVVAIVRMRDTASSGNGGVLAWRIVSHGQPVPIQHILWSLGVALIAEQ